MEQVKEREKRVQEGGKKRKPLLNVNLIWKQIVTLNPPCNFLYSMDYFHYIPFHIPRAL